MTKNLGQASIPAVKQYLQLAEAQQLDIDKVLMKISLPYEVINDNSQHISGEQFQQLIAELITLSDDPLFGLHTAQYVQPGSYSVLGYIVMNCATLGEAIEKIQPFEKLVGDMGVTDIKQCNELLTITWHCRFPDLMVRRHMIDNCLASWLTFARYLTNNQGSPVKVLLARKQPDLQQTREYQRLFNCPILFNQTNNAIVFHQNLLNLPLNKGDKNVRVTLEQHAQSLLAHLTANDIISQCQRLIKQALSVQQVSQENIARQLKISGKTLQRRLKTKQTTFQQLVNEVRLTQAQTLLKDRNLTLNDISLQLGFKEPRSFYRWFKQLTHTTPRAYQTTQNDCTRST